jgi:hypothetical protein
LRRQADLPFVNALSTRYGPHRRPGLPILLRNAAIAASGRSGDGDYALYRGPLAQASRKFGVAVWAYCL